MKVLNNAKLDIDQKFRGEFSEEGFTLLELLVSTFILSIILSITVSMFVVYNTSFNASVSLSKAQLQGEIAMNSLASYARSSIPCPNSTSEVISYSQATPSLAISAPFTHYTFNSVATPVTTTDIGVVTITLDKATNDLTASITPCPGYTGIRLNPVSANNVTSLTFGFVEAQTNGIGEPIWTSTNPPSITSSPLTPYSSDNIIGIQFSVQISVSGVSVTLTNTGYFNNFFCQGTSAPPGAGGCVV